MKERLVICSNVVITTGEMARHIYEKAKELESIITCPECDGEGGIECAMCDGDRQVYQNNETGEIRKI